MEMTLGTAAFGIATSATGNAIESLGKYLLKKAKKTHTNIITLNARDETLRLWYRENISKDSRQLATDVTTLNSIVLEDDFLDAFEMRVLKLNPHQQFLLSAYLWALRALDRGVARRLDQIEERFSMDISEMETRISQKLEDEIRELQTQEGSFDTLSSPTRPLNFTNIAVCGTAGVGAIFLASKASIWANENPDEAIKTLKAIIGIGITIYLGKKLFGFLQKK